MAKRKEERGARSFPFKDSKGRWHHPKTGKVMSNSAAKEKIRRVERDIVVRNIARTARTSQKEVRAYLARQGVKTSDIVGRWKYFNKKTGKQVRDKPTKKGLRALRHFGIVNADGLLDY